jgi:hypothetical protein
MHRDKQLPSLDRIGHEYGRGHLSSPGPDKHLLVSLNTEGLSVEEATAMAATLG